MRCLRERIAEARIIVHGRQPGIVDMCPDKADLEHRDSESAFLPVSRGAPPDLFRPCPFSPQTRRPGWTRKVYRSAIIWPCSRDDSPSEYAVEKGPGWQRAAGYIYDCRARLCLARASYACRTVRSVRRWRPDGPGCRTVPAERSDERGSVVIALS